MIHQLEKGATHLQRIQKPFAAIIDGMALVRKVKPTGHTYDSYTDEVLKAAIVSSSGAEGIDIVFDVYRKHSIKNADRRNIESGKLLVKRIIGKQPIKQFLAFLSNGENKMKLIRFLASRWQINQLHHLQNKFMLPMANLVFYLVEVISQIFHVIKKRQILEWCFMLRR